MKVEKENLVTAGKALIAGVAAFWVSMHPLMQLLLLAMFLDIATGLLSAYVSQTVSSQASMRGAAKKTLILLLVWGGWIIGTQLGQPVGEAVAGFYILNEMISVVENATAAGLPVPRALSDALAKLSDEKPGPTKGAV